MNNENFGSGDDAPQDADLRLYARAWSGAMTPDELFLRAETYLAHSLLLGRAPDRSYPEHRLTGHQLSQGALIAARRMALLLSEMPTGLREVLALRIHLHEAMSVLERETTASNTVHMIAASIKVDAERLGVELLPLAHSRGRGH
ncbi:hypothetical protein ACXIUS_24050 [Bosea thiooxidans]|nr:hypothetical protein [Bosea sp. (in: a-proteobacteria)]